MRHLSANQGEYEPPATYLSLQCTDFDRDIHDTRLAFSGTDGFVGIQLGSACVSESWCLEQKEREEEKNGETVERRNGGAKFLVLGTGL
jgi:hypothetical protein